MGDIPVLFSINPKIIEVNNELVNKIGLSYGILKADSSSDGIMAISTNLNGGSKSIEEAVALLDIDVKKLNLKSGLALGASYINLPEWKKRKSSRI